MKRFLVMASVAVGLPSALLAACSDDDGGGPGGDAGSSSGGSSSDGGSGGTGGGAGDGAGAEDCIKRGPITEDTTWEPIAECPDGFDVPSNIEVSGTGTTLTIRPGTKLKFESDAGLDIQANAALSAVGTEDEPVVFTGWQELAGSWQGIGIESTAVANEIRFAIVEYAGADGGPSGAIAVAGGSSPGRLELESTTIRSNKKFGLTVLDGAALGAFASNEITQNEGGAVRVQPTVVHYLSGTNNSFTDNGSDNIVQIETNILVPLIEDVTWPDVSPAVYRVTGANGDGGGQIYVKSHLTIDPGAVFEFNGGGGIDVRDGSAGLSAVGTADSLIVFRGVDDSGWAGIGFCESNWTGNALEHVEIRNAFGPPEAWGLCGTGATDVKKPGVLVGHNFAAKPSALRIKDIKILGPNNAAADIGVNEPQSILTQEGTNTGTGAGEALVIELF